MKEKRNKHLMDEVLVTGLFVCFLRVLYENTQIHPSITIRLFL